MTNEIEMKKDKTMKWKEGKLEGGGLFILLFGFLVFVVRTNEMERTRKNTKRKKDEEFKQKWKMRMKNRIFGK